MRERVSNTGKTALSQALLRPMKKFMTKLSQSSHTGSLKATNSYASMLLPHPKYCLIATHSMIHSEISTFREAVTTNYTSSVRE